MFQYEVCSIEEHLQKIKCCTITTDMWTAGHQNHSLIVHFVDSDFSKNSLCLKNYQEYTSETLKRVHTFISIRGLEIQDKVFDEIRQ